jgi:multidrug efflux pump subunit AcrB
MPPLSCGIYGSDMDGLREIGNQLRAELAQVEDVIHTRANLTEALPKLALQVDEAQAQRTGMDNRTIANQLRQRSRVAPGGSILDGTKTFRCGCGYRKTSRGTYRPSVPWKW